MQLQRDGLRLISRTAPKSAFGSLKTIPLLQAGNISFLTIENLCFDKSQDLATCDNQWTIFFVWPSHFAGCLDF